MKGCPARIIVKGCPARIILRGCSARIIEIARAGVHYEAAESL